MLPSLRWRRTLAVLLAVQLLSIIPSAPPAGAQLAGCTFSLSFRILRDQIPQIVGECLEDEPVNPASGDVEQRTVGGMLTWRKADDLTTFTDGTTTWINGPQGLVSRPNAGPPFPWEAAVAAPAAPAPGRAAVTAPAPTPVPTPAEIVETASGPITKEPAEIALGLGDVGKEIYQDYLTPGSDNRSKWAEIRFARTPDAYDSRIGPMKIVNRVYVVKGVLTAQAVYKDEVAKQPKMPESEKKVGGRVGKWETVGNVYVNEGAQAPEKFGDEQVSHAACNDDCNSANFTALHQRAVVRYQNVVAVLYFWGERSQASPIQATEWLRVLRGRFE